MLKVSENPPRMHPGAGTLTDLAGTWWVAHTKARSEKALAWDLLRRDIGYFLPLLGRVRFSGGRKRRVLMPLFPFPPLIAMVALVAPLIVDGMKIPRS